MIVELTSIKTLTVTFRVGELDIDKVNLQLLLGLDTDQEGRTTTSGDNFVGVVGGLEVESK